MNPSDVVSAQITKWRRWAATVGGTGTALAIVGLFINPSQFLRSYLYGYVLWTGLAVGCLGILLLHHTVGGKWGLVIRRMAEGGARTLPFMFVLVLPILIGITSLYIWARPEAAYNANIQSKHLYLNVPFFVVRTVLYFVVWTFYGWRLSNLSRQQDRTGDDHVIGKMRGISAPGLVVFTFVSTFAFVDWIMSLEPQWFSTIYGAMFLIGQMLGAFALLIGLLIVFSKRGQLGGFVTPQHLHDLGNMMFAFMVLWAYLAFSQFLITWSGNQPDEIPWYLRRLRGGWGWVALAVILFHFAAPFALLLMRGIKRNAERLFNVCVLLFAIHCVDVYWIVEPSFYNQQLRIHWLDALLPVAIGGLWLSMFLSQLRERSLLPLRDPALAEAPRETVAF